MVYVEILAGGIGSRMNDSNSIPKQYLSINGKPAIIYTVEKFLNNQYVDKVIIGCQDDWKKHLEEILEKYIDKSYLNRINIYPSGENRNITIINGCTFIQDTYGVNEDDIIITMDATRIMISDEIITNNILSAKEHSAVITAFPVVDTIASSSDGSFADTIPVRSTLYSIQTPETFNLKKLMDYYYNTSESQKATITSIAKLFLLNNEKIYMVRGSYNNIKITYKNDLNIIKNMLDN